jgi:hypothetical protein
MAPTQDSSGVVVLGARGANWQVSWEFEEFEEFKVGGEGKVRNRITLVYRMQFTAAFSRIDLHLLSLPSTVLSCGAMIKSWGHEEFHYSAHSIPTRSPDTLVMCLRCCYPSALNSLFPDPDFIFGPVLETDIYIGMHCLDEVTWSFDQFKKLYYRNAYSNLHFLPSQITGSNPRCRYETHLSDRKGNTPSKFQPSPSQNQLYGCVRIGSTSRSTGPSIPPTYS